MKGYYKEACNRCTVLLTFLRERWHPHWGLQKQTTYLFIGRCLLHLASWSCSICSTLHKYKTGLQQAQETKDSEAYLLPGSWKLQRIMLLPFGWHEMCADHASSQSAASSHFRTQLQSSAVTSVQSMTCTALPSWEEVPRPRHKWCRGPDTNMAKMVCESTRAQLTKRNC